MYEYLTGQELGLKPSTVEQAKFDYSPLGNDFTKGLEKEEDKERLFKRLKNIENAQKNLINGNDNDDDESIYKTPRSRFDGEHDEDKDQEKQQKINIGSKPQNVFDYLKDLSQEAEDLMIELEDAEDDLDKEKLIFVGSNGEKVNFNAFKTLLDFL